MPAYGGAPTPYCMLNGPTLEVDPAYSGSLSEAMQAKPITDVTPSGVLGQSLVPGAVDLRNVVTAVTQEFEGLSVR